MAFLELFFLLHSIWGTNAYFPLRMSFLLRHLQMPSKQKHHHVQPSIGEKAPRAFTNVTWSVFLKVVASLPEEGNPRLDRCGFFRTHETSFH